MRVTAHSAPPLQTFRVSSEHTAVSKTATAAKATPLSGPFAGLLQSFGKSAAPSPVSSPTIATITPPASSTNAASPSTAATTASTASPAAADNSASAVPAPGLEALVSAIQNGSFQVSYITNPSQLQEITPAGADYMPSFYYVSNQTASQIAQLLGGTVVQRPAFGQDAGYSEPLANFVQLPNGMTVNAADLAYYARCSGVGTAQLTADLTGTINAGAAWTNWYTNGGALPMFPTGYVGPPIAGMAYPAGTIGSDGNVINPGMQKTST